MNLDLASFLILPPASPSVLGDITTLGDTGLEQDGLQKMVRDETLVIVWPVLTFLGYANSMF